MMSPNEKKLINFLKNGFGKKQIILVESTLNCDRKLKSEKGFRMSWYKQVN